MSVRPDENRMRERWEEFARADALFYVDTSRRSWSEADFLAAESGLAEGILGWAGTGLQRERMLEIGCGPGRMLRHFAPHFEQVDGCDISPEMLRRAAAIGLPANVRLAESSGRDLAPYGDAEFDLVFSYLVFQHVPDEEVVAKYLREIARVLKPRGRAALQFDTRPRTLANRALGRLPDALLPRTRRAYIRRYRRSPGRVVELATEAGLALTDQRGAGTELHWLLLARAATSG